MSQAQHGASVAAAFPLSRRRLMGHGALAVVGAAAAACGVPGQGTGATEAPKTAPAAPVPLEFWNTRGTSRLGLGLHAALNDYQARNPGYVTLEEVAVTTGQAQEKVKAALAGGTPPNLLGDATQAEAANLLIVGGTLDLNQALRTSKEWAKIKADLLPSVLEGSTWRGKMPFMPMMLAQEAFGYHKPLLQRAGVPLPAHGLTWNEFIEIGRKAAQPPDVVLFEFAYTYTSLNRWMHANGVVPLNADRTKLVYDSPQMLETLTWVHDQVTRGMAKNGNDSSFNLGGSLTVSANEAAAASPPRFPNVDPAGDGTGLHITHYPFGPSNTRKAVITFGNARGMIAIKTPNAKKDEVSAQVLEWAGRAEVQPKIAEASGHPPVGQTAARQENLPPKIKNNVILRTINDFGKGAYLTPNFPNWLQAMAILQENLMRVAKGEILPKDALLDAQQKMQPLIDEDLRRA